MPRFTGAFFRAPARSRPNRSLQRPALRPAACLPLAHRFPKSPIPLLAFSHPFHIHINPFHVIEIFDPVTMDAPTVFEKDFVWHDTIGIPPAYNYYPNGKPRLDKDGKQVFVNGYVKIRSRFADFPGLYV